MGNEPIKSPGKGGTGGNGGHGVDQYSAARVTMARPIPMKMTMKTPPMLWMEMPPLLSSASSHAWAHGNFSLQDFFFNWFIFSLSKMYQLRLGRHPHTQERRLTFFCGFWFHHRSFKVSSFLWFNSFKILKKKKTDSTESIPTPDIFLCFIACIDQWSMIISRLWLTHRWIEKKKK